MDIRIEGSGIAQLIPDLPVPVGQKTIAKSVKKAQAKPRKSGQSQCDQIPLPQRLDHPPKKVEQDQANMKDKKEGIGNLIEDFHLTKLSDTAHFT